jgi:phage gp45-like
VDDTKQMQESMGNFMANEARSAIEAPQNYGFSSVVRAATKDAQGKIQQSAEGFVSFMGGNRSFPVMGIMDDRRYRPMGMKQGENSQYDDLGQMTLIRRTGLYLLSLDSPDDSQQQSGSSSGGGSAGKDASGGSSSQQNVERFVSVRHVVKQQQPRQMSGAGGQSGGSTGGSSGSSQDFQHEGQSVNNEMRVSAARIEFRSGDTVVGYYDKASATWCFIGKVKLGTESASNPVYGVNGGVGNTSDPNGSDAVLINATKPGPPTSEDTAP